LDHLVSGRHREALVGDLNEQFANGCSTFWYCRQVFAAIAIRAGKDLRDHPLLAVGTAIMIWGLVLAWVETTWWLYLWASNQWVYHWLLDKPEFLAHLWIFYGEPLNLLWCVGCVAVGWIIVRLHGARLVAMLTVAVIAELPLTFHWGWPWWLRASDLPLGLSVSVRMWSLIVLVGMPLSTLIGGLIAARGDQLQRRRSAS
jgi:hypothetical protein